MGLPANNAFGTGTRIAACVAMAALGAHCNLAVAQASITRPIVAEKVSPLETVHPVAHDGYEGLAILRKPPGTGPFPAVVLIHGGLATLSLDRLRTYVMDEALPSRFLAAGYVVASITYRSRNEDLQSQVSRDDSIAAVRYLQSLSYVDEQSVGVYGCSGGGDLVLAVAAEQPVAAVIAEEPASMMFTGVWNNAWPKAGERYTPFDSQPVYKNARQYYTEEFQRLTKAKISRIRSPIFIIQGDVETPLPVNDFNRDVLLPELRSAGRTLEVTTYSGGPHCFAMLRTAPGSASQALMAFQNAEIFLRRYVTAKPIPIDPRLVESVVVD